MTQGKEPIQPVYSTSGSPFDEQDAQYLIDRKIFTGLTKREYFSAMAMQAIITGIFSNKESYMDYMRAVEFSKFDNIDEMLSNDATEKADALINALNQPLK